jgi:hypothetical protein
MTKQALQGALDRQPFEPFVLHIADGREVDVPARDFVSMHPAGRTVVVYRDEEDLEILDVMLITGLRTSAVKK